MREILFRGKRLDNGEWVEGYLVHSVYKVGDACVGKFSCTLGTHQVDPSTVGQYTGLDDKNGKRIFEGDIVKTSDVTYEDVIQIPGELFAIELRKGCWTMVCGQNWDFLETNNRYVEVIGNIHDNKILLNNQEVGE